MKILVHYITAIAVTIVFASNASADLLTEWNYNAFSSPSSASTGTGNTTGSSFPFSNSLPNNSGSSADPGTVIFSGNVGDACEFGCLNNSNALKTGPQPGDPSGNRIIGFNTSTAGNTDIDITWDMVAGYRTSRFYQISATTDGAIFNSVSGGVGTGSVVAGVGSATVSSSGLITVLFDDLYDPDPDLDTLTPVDYLFDLSYAFASPSGIENNPNFGVQIAAVHDPAGSDYVSSFSGEVNGAPSGKGYTRESHPRYDLVSITGVPEPTSFALAAVCGLALAGVRRRRR
jgi:MYXO-CTERM domain-containing protein